VGIVGVSTDVMERKRTEEELRESEERFRAFFETAAVGAAHADPATGRLLQVNEKLCRFLGYGEEELLCMTFSDVTHPDNRVQDLEGLSRLLRGEIREVCAEITDDGVGFDPASVREALGDARASLGVGGRLVIVSTPDQRTSVKVEVPFPGSP
jgi:PAS domain S-box-containing protein